MKIVLNKMFLVMLSVVLLLAGCGAEETVEETVEETIPVEKMKIVASFYPMFEFTSKVAGDHAEVISLVPAGVEPHDWEPSPEDIKSLEEAKLLVYNGAGMEGWIVKVVDGLDNKNLILVEATHDMKLLGEEEHADKHVDEHEHEHAHEEEKHADEHAHEHGEYDPHVWLSPLRAIEQVRVIEAALSKADPQHQADYRNNADAYVVELEELHKQFQDALAPHAGKEFVTQHAAFAYIADAYNLIQLPIAGLSPENEPSAQRMAEIVAFAKEHQIRTIYFETLVSSKVAEVIAKEIGAKTAVLNPIEGLTADDLKNNANYVSLMKQNLQALLQGFEQ